MVTTVETDLLIECNYGSFLSSRSCWRQPLRVVWREPILADLHVQHKIWGGELQARAYGACKQFVASTSIRRPVSWFLYPIMKLWVKK